MFTDKQLQKLPTGMHADGDGLYIRVSPKGKKVWYVRTSVGDRSKWRNLGEYPGVTAAEARRLMSRPPADITVTEAIEQYMKVISVADPDQVRALFRQVPIDRLTITRQEMVDKLKVKAATAPVHANRILARYKEFFDFCVNSGWIEFSPLGSVKAKFVGGKETPKNRVLTWDEIATVPNDPCLWFILLTGLRPSEAMWVLRHRTCIEIPTKRTSKDGYVHKLPESRYIRAFLRIPVTVPADHRVLSHKLRRAGATYTPHDLRRTFATRLSDLGVAPHVIEKMLGHKMEGMLAVYNHAEYWPERIAAQRLWGRKLAEIWRKKPPV